MKVRVSYTIEAGDDFRRAIRSYFGEDGLATRAEVVSWMRSYGESMNDDVMVELVNAERRRAA